MHWAFLFLRVADLPIDDIISILIARNSLSQFLSVETTPTVFKNGVLISKNIPLPDTLIRREDGQRYDNQGNRILYIPQTRPAESENDFREILDREFRRRKLNNDPDVTSILRKDLEEHIENLIDLHKVNTKTGERDIQTLAIAEKFKRFLSSDTELSNSDTTVSFSQMFSYEDQNIIIQAFDEYGITKNGRWVNMVGGGVAFRYFCETIQKDFVPNYSVKSVIRCLSFKIGRPLTNIGNSLSNSRKKRKIQELLVRPYAQ